MEAVRFQVHFNKSLGTLFGTYVTMFNSVRTSLYFL